MEGELLTFAVDDRGRLAVHSGGKDVLVVALDRGAFSDLVQGVSSTFGVQLTGRAEVRRGSLDAFVEWEPVLRGLLDGRPVYEPGTIGFHDPKGVPLDLHRSFSLDDAPGEMGEFLAEAGFLHIEGMFTDDEMAAVSAELDAAVAEAEPTTARRRGRVPPTASGTRRGSSGSTRSQGPCGSCSAATGSRRSGGARTTASCSGIPTSATPRRGC